MSHRTPTAVVAALVLLSACTPKEAVKTPPPVPNVVNVTASDFSFVVPPEIPAGMTTFKLMNKGPNLHHMVIARLDSGKTVEDAKAAMAKPHAPPPSWVVPVGGPNAPDPNTESNVTVDMKPGDYLVFCVVDIPGAVPHFAKGMITGMKVTPNTAAPAPAPTADVKVKLADYKFELSTPLTAGKHTIQVNIAPGQPHEVEILKFAPGKNMNDLMKAMGELMAGKPLTGPMPVIAIGGTTPASSDATLYFDVDLTPGNYVMLCFLPDPKDGKAHMEHGMSLPFTIQ